MWTPVKLGLTNKSHMPYKWSMLWIYYAGMFTRYCSLILLRLGTIISVAVLFSCIILHNSCWIVHDLKQLFRALKTFQWAVFRSFRIFTYLHFVISTFKLEQTNGKTGRTKPVGESVLTRKLIISCNLQDQSLRSMNYGIGEKRWSSCSTVHCTTVFVFVLLCCVLNNL